METSGPGGVRYQEVESGYLEKRQLRRSARWLVLWAMGVGAVISGDYFGWNFGLAAGGFGGLAIATIIVAAMYFCMVYSIAELSTMLPHAGGFYSYARNAFGPWGGFLVGMTDAIEYVLTPAVIVVGVGGYLHALVPGVPAFVWWVIAYALFIAINIRGVELTFRVGLIITLLAMAVLVIFFGATLWTGAFRSELLFNLAPAAGETSFLPRGAWGIFAAIPFAIWFFLAIEQLPLASEETVDVVRDMPRALILGLLTLLVLALATLVLNSGVGGGVVTMAKSAAPLADGFTAVFGAGATTTILTLIALTGLIASFHAIIFAYGRVLFSLSRAGYLPLWLSVTGRNTKTPHWALLIGGLVGLIAAAALDRFGTGSVGAALLNMAVFGAVLSYAAVMLSYIRLRATRPDLPRPYRSPLGVPGAWLGLILAIVSGVATFATPEYRPAVVGVAVFLAIAMIYFATYSSRRLVAQAPEEQTALR